MTKKNNVLTVIDTLWDYNDPKNTAVKFSELLPQAKSKKDLSYYAELLTQLARTQSLQGNFDEAHHLLDEAELVLNSKMIVPRIRYCLERGRTYNSANKKKTASELFIKAYNLALKHHQNFYLVDAAHMLGISEPPETQLNWNIKAIELAEKSKDERTNKWLGPLYNNTGWTYHDLGKYDEAMKLFEKSLAWRKKQKDRRGAFIAKWTIGRCYRSLNKIAKALKIQQSLLKEMEAGKAAQDGYVYEELAECLLLQGKRDEAQPYFKQAFKLLSKDNWLQANEKERLERLKMLGKK